LTLPKFIDTQAADTKVQPAAPHCDIPAQTNTAATAIISAKQEARLNGDYARMQAFPQTIGDMAIFHILGSPLNLAPNLNLNLISRFKYKVFHIKQAAIVPPCWQMRRPIGNALI
jgi:hypothetical protein